jgi:hypothetical protein
MAIKLHDITIDIRPYIKQPLEERLNDYMRYLGEPLHLEFLGDDLSKVLVTDLSTSHTFNTFPVNLYDGTLPATVKEICDYFKRKRQEFPSSVIRAECPCGIDRRDCDYHK